MKGSYSARSTIHVTKRLKREIKGKSTYKLILIRWVMKVDVDRYLLNINTERKATDISKLLYIYICMCVGALSQLYYTRGSYN